VGEAGEADAQGGEGGGGGGLCVTGSSQNSPPWVSGSGQGGSVRNPPVTEQPQKGNPSWVRKPLQQGSGMCRPTSSRCSIHLTAALCRMMVTNLILQLLCWNEQHWDRLLLLYTA